MATISFGTGIWAFVRPSWSPEFFGGVRGQMHHRPGAWQPSGSGGQCASQPSLLPRTFAVPCLCHGPHIAFSHSRSLLAKHRTTRRVCMCSCVRPCVRVHVCGSVHHAHTHTPVVCVCVGVNTAHAGDRPLKSGGARGFRGVKGPWKRADGCSKPATPRTALCDFLHHGLVAHVCISPAGGNGSLAISLFFGQMRGRLHPLPLLSHSFIEAV